MLRLGNTGSAPVWARHKRWLHAHIPPRLAAWLLDPASLTDRIQRACSGRFSVRVLGEGWTRPKLDEARALRMRISTLGWVREVQLLCDGQPWIYARTVIPVNTLSGAQRRLAYLGNRPLGAYLFAHPGMSRGTVEVAQIRKGQAILARATSGISRPRPVIWGRRSVFTLKGKPLLVTEVFLPVMDCYGKSDPFTLR